MSAHAQDTLSATATGTAVWQTGTNWQDGSSPTLNDDVVIDRSNGATATGLAWGTTGVQVAKSITYGSANVTNGSLGAFSIQGNSTASTATRTMTLATGNISVDPTVTGTSTYGVTGFGNLIVNSNSTAFNFTNNTTTQALNFNTRFGAEKDLTLTSAGGAITINTSTGAPVFTSLNGGSGVTSFVNSNTAAGTQIITLSGGAGGAHSFAGLIKDGSIAKNALTIN